jgi:hypothetical protein
VAGAWNKVLAESRHCEKTPERRWWEGRPPGKIWELCLAVNRSSCLRGPETEEGCVWLRSTRGGGGLRRMSNGKVALIEVKKAARTSPFRDVQTKVSALNLTPVVVICYQQS